MEQSVTFHGASGRAAIFERMLPADTWARTAGVAIFAAPDAYGWRIVDMVELSGRPHDVQPIWALSRAERFGVTAVFVHTELDRETRLALIDDLEAGLSPVLTIDRPSPNLAVAA